MRKFWGIMLGVVIVAALPALADTCLLTGSIDRGTNSGFDPSPRCDSGDCPGLNITVEDRDTWRKLWTQHTSNINPAPALPNVDFRRQIVIASFSGKRPTTSHSTTIECIESTPLIGGGAAWTANVVNRSPGNSCVVQPAITNPYDIVLVDRPTDGFGRPLRVAVSYETTEVVVGCGGGDPPFCRVCTGGNGDGDLDDFGQGFPCCP